MNQIAKLVDVVNKRKISKLKQIAHHFQLSIETVEMANTGRLQLKQVLAEIASIG